MGSPLVLGVSLKMYFGYTRTLKWVRDVAAIVRGEPVTMDGSVELFAIPSYLAITAAVAEFAGTGARVGAQNVSSYEPGPLTGEVSAAELAEAGVKIVEIGHAERRGLFGETDQVVAEKTALALRNGLTPLICVGEPTRGRTTEAVQYTVRQLRRALEAAPSGPVIVAYEPVWSIGATEPAPVEHIREMCLALQADLGKLGRSDCRVIYGGSAGPGLLGELAGAADGLFLGRSAHDPAALRTMIREASEVLHVR